MARHENAKNKVQQNCTWWLTMLCTVFFQMNFYLVLPLVFKIRWRRQQVGCTSAVPFIGCLVVSKTSRVVEVSFSNLFCNQQNISHTLGQRSGAKFNVMDSSVQREEIKPVIGLARRCQALPKTNNWNDVAEWKQFEKYRSFSFQISSSAKQDSFPCIPLFLKPALN